MVEPVACTLVNCDNETKAKSTTAGQQKTKLDPHFSQKLQCMRSGTTTLVSTCSTGFWSDITQVWSMMSHSTDWVQRFNRVVTLTLLAPRPVRCFHLAHAGPDLPPDPRGRAAHKTLRERREDGHACMSADNKVLHDSHARTRQTGGELIGVDNVESCHTNDFAVVETQLLVVLTHGRSHGVHKVHNHSHHRVGTELFTNFEESPGDASVDLKEVITSYRVLWHTSGNEHQVAPHYTLIQLIHRRL